MAGESVAVHVNREGQGTVAAAADAVESTGPFSIDVVNHGAPVHVHCRFDGDLAAIASVLESNVYVESEAEATVPVQFGSVDALEGPVRGTLEVATQYGAASTSIAITLRPGPEPVDVDESLGKPPGEEGPSGSGSGTSSSILGITGVDPGTLGVLALSLVAVAVGLAAASIVGGTATLVAVVVAVIGLGTAVAFLRGTASRSR